MTEDKKKSVKQYNYFNDRNAWVTFTNSKNKIKLRKYIGQFSRKLEEFNNKTYKENRNILIEQYESKGISAIVSHYNSEVELFLKKCKTPLSQTKKSEALT